MNHEKSYAGIDCFRLFAALLVVTIHTSPLASFSQTGDFILTRVLARVAVPFFFTTSGFFLISRYARNAHRLEVFVRRTALIYLAAILLYLPVNLYNGYFAQDNLIANLFRDLVLDGTFYHLWYLPASMIGGGIAWWLVRRLGYKMALAVALVLYLVGLLGDSYYGFAEKVPFLQDAYRLVFQAADYTRNGLFFAPVFFVMGGLIADMPHRLSFWKSMGGLGVGMALLLAEAMWLRPLGVRRHDSMYLLLLPCVYFLFCALLHFKGRRFVWMRTLSLCLYILHPMMILVVRLAARLFSLQGLLIENSGVHFLGVCIASMAASALVTALLNRRRKSKPAGGTDRAWIEVDTGHLLHNVQVLQKTMPPACRLMAVVKAQAYGHGAFEVAACLDKNGVGAFAVATIDEGIELRRYGVRGEILILGYTAVCRAAELKRYRLMQTLIDREYALALDRQGVAVKAHLKIDTGMHRLGIPWQELTQVKQVFSLKHIQGCGLYTHLCCPDSLQPDDVEFTRLQIRRFYALAGALQASGVVLPKMHIQSSWGLLNYPDIHCDYVRVGIALYGVPSSSQAQAVRWPDLRPVLSLKSRVVLIRSVPKGESVGYSRGFTAQRDSRVAVIPIGYGDGVPRRLSGGRGAVRVRQYLVPVIGQICMDQLTVDITDAPEVAVGDTVTLIEAVPGSELAAPVVAGRAESISNELLCRMGARLPIRTVG